MNSTKSKFFFGALTILLVLILAGGKWSSGLSAGLPQSTIPTTTPTTAPEPDPTATPNPTERPRPPVTGPVPLIFITTVVCDDTVTIRSANFPPNTNFAVLMNYYGTLGINGIQVDTVNSGAGGAQSWTFKIPDSLKGQIRIAIRLVSYSTGYFAYNWFWNNNTEGPGNGCPVVAPGPSDQSTLPTTPALPFPSFSAQAVVRDQSVTVLTKNLPANDTFVVTMNLYGTKGIGGTQVATVESGAGGALTLTFNVPDSLKGQDRIAVRMQSPKSGYYAFNWFWNNTYP